MRVRVSWFRLVKLRVKDNYDGGLLLLRVGIGLMFVLAHGLPKVLGGVSMWIKLGGAFNRLIGIDFVPAFWGFMATFAEFGGGLCLALGVFFRSACGLVLFTLTIAILSILRGGYGFAEHRSRSNSGSSCSAFSSPAPAASLFPMRSLHSDQGGNYAQKSQWPTSR